jgi:membrane protein required for colicin V production
VRWISDTAYLNILSFLIIFSSVFILISILGVIIKYLLNIAYLGWVDRISGAGFGALKGILIVSVILVAFTSFLPKGAPIIRDSLLAPIVTRISENLAKVVPPEMKGQFIEKAEDFKKTWKI